MYLFSTGQIFQSGLRVEGNESSSTFCDKSGDAVLSYQLLLIFEAISRLWEFAFSSIIFPILWVLWQDT